MTAPFRVRDLASIMGGWPFLRSSDGSPITQLVDGVVNRMAKIVGARQEPSGGFAGLDTKSFLLYVDSDPNSPFTVTFSDPGSSGLTTDDLVTQINATTTPGPLPGTVAYNENNILVLKSPSEGDGSYLKVATVAGSEGILPVIGMFAGTESWGGELAQSPHVDPDRQVSLPGQASMMWGENFSATVFNRLAMQMAVHTDRSIGTLERKRIAVFKRKARAVGDIQTGAGGKYFRLITTPGPTDEEWLYMGPHASGDPEFDPELALAIVDADGNEITQDDENVLDSTDVEADMQFAWATDEKSQAIADLGIPAIFASVTAEGDYYARVTGLAAPADVLNGRLLKIVRKISSSTVEVRPLDADGNVVQITNAQKTGTMTLEAVQVITKKVKAEGFYKDAALTTRLEQVQETKVAASTIDALELNNRVVVTGGQFLTGPEPVVAGDIATIAGHTNTVPHSNNGDYRVSQVIDDDTLELVGSDWGPVYLNTQTAVSYGTLTVKSDGDFYSNPYVKFDDDDIVPTGDFYVLYQAMRSFKDAVDEDPAVFAAPTKYLQEGAHNTTKAILGIIGPSVDNLTEAINWLYGDRRNNMEDLYDRLNKEHYDHDSAEGGGRHSNIRPDTIDMFPEVAGETVTLRAATADSGIFKVALYNGSGSKRFGITEDGKVWIGDVPATPTWSDDLIIRRLTSSPAVFVYTASGSGSADVYVGTDNDYYAGIQASNISDTASLYLTAGGSNYWYLELDGDILTLKSDADVYLRAHDTRQQLVACMDLVPEFDEDRLLGTPSYMWKEFYTYKMYVEWGSGADWGVDSDFVPTTDGSFRLGVDGYSWDQLYLLRSLEMYAPPASAYGQSSIMIDKSYSQYAASISTIYNGARFVGVPSSGKTRTGIFNQVTWEGTLGGFAVWQMHGIRNNFSFSLLSTLDIQYGYGFYSGGSAGGGTAKIGRFYHYYAGNFSAPSGNLDYQYGLYIESLTYGAIEKWAIYTAGTTPSYFGGTVNAGAFTTTGAVSAGSLGVTGDAVVDGDLTVKGADLILNEGATQLARLGKSGVDGTLTLKDDAANVVMTGTELYYAKEWANLDKGKNFVLTGLSLEARPEAPLDNVNCQVGTAFINGELVSFGETTVVHSWLAGSVPGTNCWAFVYRHQTEGVKLGIKLPNYAGGRPPAGEDMSGVSDTNVANWLYLGAVYWLDSPTLHFDSRRWRRTGDWVWYDTTDHPARDYPLVFNDSQVVGAGEIINTMGMEYDDVSATHSRWVPSAEADCKVPGLIVTASFYDPSAITGGNVLGMIYHGVGDTRRCPAASCSIGSSYGHRFEVMGPFPLFTYREPTAKELQWDWYTGPGTSGTLAISVHIMGYLDPVNAPRTNRYLYPA